MLLKHISSFLTATENSVLSEVRIAVYSYESEMVSSVFRWRWTDVLMDAFWSPAQHNVNAFHFVWSEMH